MYRRRFGSKYGNKTTTFNDRAYDSKLEAKYAQQLDTALKGGAIRGVTAQFRLDLSVNGTHICNYIVDFLVTNNDGSLELWEIKGYETDVWKLKWKLAQALYGDKYKFVVIK